MSANTSYPGWVNGVGVGLLVFLIRWSCGIGPFQMRCDQSNVTCYPYVWGNSQQATFMSKNGDRHGILITPSGRGKGKFRGGRGNIQATVNGRSVICLGSNYSGLGYGVCGWE